MLKPFTAVALSLLGGALTTACEGLNACGNLRDKAEICGFDDEDHRLPAAYLLGSQEECSAEQSCAAACVLSLSCEDLPGAVAGPRRTADPNAVPFGAASPRAKKAHCCVASCMDLYPLFSREECDRAANFSE